MFETMKGFSCFGFIEVFVSNELDFIIKKKFQIWLKFENETFQEKTLLHKKNLKINNFLLLFKIKSFLIF